MDILIIGLGVIGTTYASVFKEAGHNVEHYIREGSNKEYISNIEVTLLDGRESSKGIQVKKEYTVNPHSKKEYDMIFVSISQGKIANVMEILRKEAFKGTTTLVNLRRVIIRVDHRNDSTRLHQDRQLPDGCEVIVEYATTFVSSTREVIVPCSLW